uniref:Putative secreted protein n=1 Tax=Desmodus rotundus TaxID=9430 RepID=K9IG81_DESRO
MSKGCAHAQTPQLPDALAALSGLRQRQKPLRDAARGSRWVVVQTPRPPPPVLLLWLPLLLQSRGSPFKFP